MIKNYIKTTLRSLLKNRSFSFLNIAGLAIGIACASLIFLWVQDEMMYNHNYAKRDLLYKVYENQTYNGKTSTFFGTPGPMWKAIKAEIPGIKNTARMTGDGDNPLECHKGVDHSRWVVGIDDEDSDNVGVVFYFQVQVVQVRIPMVIGV